MVLTLNPPLFWSPSREGGGDRGWTTCARLVGAKRREGAVLKQAKGTALPDKRKRHPEPPSYLAGKRNIYSPMEPAWEALRDDNSVVAWRIVSWGGVLIGARPFGHDRRSEQLHSRPLRAFGSPLPKGVSFLKKQVPLGAGRAVRCREKPNARGSRAQPPTKMNKETQPIMAFAKLAR